MDKLKEYLLGHKADLDVDSPASDGWESIESKLRDESHRTPVRSARAGWIVRYAAAACVIALAGLGVWLVMKDRKAPAGTAKIEGGKAKVEGGAAKIDSGTAKIEGGTAKVESGKEKRGRRTRHKTRVQMPTQISDEISAIDKSYSTLIDYQLKKLRATPLYAENGSYFSFYIEQFKEMDRDEKQVRSDINTYGLNSEFLEQLINVYQQKLNLLKNLQTEINKMNNKVREKEAPSAKTSVYYLNI